MQIIFLNTENDNWSLSPNNLISSLYDAKLLTKIYVGNERTSETIDIRLWTNKKLSFIPHSIITSAEQDDALPKSVVRIITGRLDEHKIGEISVIYDFESQTLPENFKQSKVLFPVDKTFWRMEAKKWWHLLQKSSYKPIFKQENLFLSELKCQTTP